MLIPVLLATPWLALLAFLAFRVRIPRELPPTRPPTPPSRAPFVSVVVPARDEAANIEACVRSLAGSAYPDFEIVVVDDRSEDGTGDLARAIGTDNARRLTVIDGEAVPAGWLGKPWACHQGARAAGGEVLLFTDADTVHGPDLLARAVATLLEERADLVTLAGRQIMGSFWERLVQPQIFLAMVLRFYDAEASVARGNWRDAIANGQFMLFTREAYAALGGHEAVRDEVVEDLALAQRTVRKGRTLVLRRAEDAFATRMYRSLDGLVEGWSKNIVTGGLQSMPRPLRPFVAPASMLGGLVLWLLPPVALVAALFGAGGSGLWVWATTTVTLSLLLWTAFTVRMGAPFGYGFLYPLGACVSLYIFGRSWTRGRHVEWKGRTYVLKDVSERP